MDSNPICHPSPAQKMKCSFLDYAQCLMIGRAGRWTQTPSTTPLQPKKWNAWFRIMFNFWWLAGLVDGLKPHPLSPLSGQKIEMLIFGLCSTSDDRLGWSMDSNPICKPSKARRMKCSDLDYVQLLMISWAGQWTQTPFATHLQPKNELLSLGLRWTSDDRLGWLMDSNPIHHPSSAKKWNAHFWITFNFWWSARLVHGLKPHLPPISSPKNEMLIFGLRSMSDDRPGWWMDSNPIRHLSPAKKMKCSFLDYVQLLMISQAGSWTQTPFATHLQPKKWNAHFWITLNVWWSAGLVDGLKPHPPPLSSQKNEMLIFGLRSTSDDQPGWFMDSNPICHPSPAQKMKCSFLDYAQCLMIGRAGGWTQTPSATSLQPKKWNAHFWITFNFWWSARLVHGLKPHLPPISSPKNEMLIFGLCSMSDDWPGWSMDSNPICHPSPAKKMKRSFLDYVQLLMIGRAGGWTQTSSPLPSLRPKNWNAHIWIMFNFWWSAGLVNGLKPHLQTI